MWDDFNDDSWEEGEESPFRKKNDNISKHPLMLKSLEIVDLTHALVGSLDEARRELYGGLMMESASVLAAKFSGAEGMDDYILKMENAVIMKVHARSLNAFTYQLAMESTHAEEHLNLLREAIGEFKKLFVQWISAFDRGEKNNDGWGLFED
jgi:hypothetical protein